MRRSLFIRASVQVTLLIAIALCCGCDGVKRRHWSEEVTLDDGHRIVIERFVKFQTSNALGGGAYGSTDLESTLRFRGELSELPAWDVPLVPLVLFKEHATNEWVVVATTGNCDTWYERGEPVPPYWEYRLRGGTWLLSVLSKDSVGRKSNLFFDYEPSDPRTVVTEKIKHRAIATNEFSPGYLSIRAEEKTNCM